MPLTPKNRKEEWLEGFVQHETTLTPKNREEAWAKEIIDASGGGGGGGTGGGVVVINPSENNSVTIDGETYDKITLAPNEAENLSFILVDPSILTSPQVIYFYDSLAQEYMLMTQCRSFQTETISSNDVNNNNIYPTSPITLWLYFSSSTHYYLIPNNATYAVGTKGK